MCPENVFENIVSEVGAHASQLFAEKLADVILYGSYARGDYDSESDIDIMILAYIDSSEICRYLYELREKIYRIEIEKDCVLSLSIIPYSDFMRYKNVSPFYRAVDKEGIRFAG